MAIWQISIRPQCYSCWPDVMTTIKLKNITRFAELFHHATELVYAWPIPETPRKLEKKSVAVRVEFTAVKSEGRYFLAVSSIPPQRVFLASSWAMVAYLLPFYPGGIEDWTSSSFFARPVHVDGAKWNQTLYRRTCGVFGLITALSFRRCRSSRSMAGLCLTFCSLCFFMSLSLASSIWLDCWNAGSVAMWMPFWYVRGVVQIAL